MQEKKLRVKQIRSGYSRVPKHRKTLRALGLGRIGKTSVLPNNPSVRGMLHQVDYLIEVASVEEKE